MNTITMTQEEARTELIKIIKNAKHVNFIRLLTLHFVTIALFAVSIISIANGTIASSIGSVINYLIAVTYVNLLAKFLNRYSTSKNALKRLNAGFEEDFNYIEVYETCNSLN